jgi:hypothetical protein
MFPKTYRIESNDHKPMLKLTTLLCTLFPFSLIAFGQIQPIVVSEQTIKVSGENELYFGFAEGDEIIFDMQVVKGKNVKEVEIIEYPSSSKFFEFKSTSISEKRIKVNKTAIYLFRIKGGGLGVNVCQIKILRIPSSDETTNFDTSVNWKIRRDSTYQTRYRKVLIKTDTTATTFIDRGCILKPMWTIPIDQNSWWNYLQIKDLNCGLRKWFPGLIGSAWGMTDWFNMRRRRKNTSWISPERLQL